MSYTIKINEGALEFSFDSPRTKFIPRIVNTWNDAGFLDSSEFVIRLSGMLRGTGGDPEADVMAKWLALKAVAERNTPQRIQIIRGSTVEIDLKPADMIDGPFIRGLETEDSGAAFANHVKFAMEIAATTAGAEQFASNPEVINLRRTIETETYNDELERKEWRATATGDDAFDLVTSFKPQGVEPLREILTREIDTNQASARYIFETKKGDLRVEESISVEPAGRPINPILLIPNAAGEGQEPILRRGRLRPATVTVRGTATSKDKSLLVPANHFSSELFDATKSPHDVEARFIPDTKLFQVTYTETYIFPAGTAIPTPDHGDHVSAFEPVEEPDDGLINS